MPLSAGQQKNIRTWFEFRNLPLDKEMMANIAEYQDLLLSWTDRINLISKGDRSAIVENHILDALGPHEMVPVQGSLIDIGTGAGLPGIPLALLRPRLAVTLMESIHKKILFLRATKDRLGLANVEIVEGRFGDVKLANTFDIVTLRALPAWESYLGKIKEIIKPGGKIIYYKQRGVYTVITE